MSAAMWKQAEAAHWINDGQAKAPQTVYVFTDPNCPYCNKFWADARPWVDSGKVELRHIMVGILTPTSAGKALIPHSGRGPGEVRCKREADGAMGPASDTGRRLARFRRRCADARWRSRRRAG